MFKRLLEHVSRRLKEDKPSADSYARKVAEEEADEDDHGKSYDDAYDEAYAWAIKNGYEED